MDALPRRPANHVPLTPLDFLRWVAQAYPAKTAVVYGPLRRTYAEFHDRARALASP